MFPSQRRGLVSVAASEPASSCSRFHGDAGALVFYAKETR